MDTKPAGQMSKGMWIGVIVGLGVAVAGGVAAFSYVGQQDTSQLNAVEIQRGEQECWDEQVAAVADPKDRNRIAGTAVGAVVGGAVGKDVGDRDITTAVGAAAGALIGRKVQEEIQENRADQRTVTTTQRRCAPLDP